MGLTEWGKGESAINTGEWGGRGSGVGGAVWIGMSGRGGGERGQTVGWEGERVGIDRRRGGVRWGEIRDRQEGDCGGRGGEWE